MSETTTKHEGACHCGAVKFTVALLNTIYSHPQGLSRYHFVITYLVPLRTFIPW